MSAKRRPPPKKKKKGPPLGVPSEEPKKKKKAPKPPKRDKFGRFLPKKKAKSGTPAARAESRRKRELAPIVARDRFGRFLPKPSTKVEPKPVEKISARRALALGTIVHEELNDALVGVAREVSGQKRTHLYDSGEVSGHVYMRGFGDNHVTNIDDFVGVVASALAECADAMRRFIPPLAFYQDLGTKMIMSFVKDDSVPLQGEYEDLDQEHEARSGGGLKITGSDLDRSRRGAGGQIIVDAETGHFFGDVNAPVNVLRTQVLGRLAEYIEETFDLDAAARQGTFPYQPYSVQMMFTWSPHGEKMLRRGVRSWE
jgi:hypothetical protein